VRQRLSFVHGMNLALGFEFHDDLAVNQAIGSKAAFNFSLHCGFSNLVKHRGTESTEEVKE
jgi:hypothetical protein